MYADKALGRKALEQMAQQRVNKDPYQTLEWQRRLHRWFHRKKLALMGVTP